MSSNQSESEYIKGKTSKVYKTQEEEQAYKVREGFTVLTHGVELIHFETINMLIGGQRSKKKVWMDADTLRICVEDNRPTLADRAKGKVPYGLYIRDIAEVRAGAETYDFRRNPKAPTPEEEELCLSLIGSECTLSLMFPSNFARDWFLERFQLVIDDILSEEEKALRAQKSLKSWLFAAQSPEEVESAEQLKTLLLRGIQILHHHPNGSIIRSYIVYDEENMRLVVQPVKTYFFTFLMPKICSLHISDIAEIRPGTHSVGFVKSNSTHLGSECLALIGTEGALDLEFATNNARDLFSIKLKSFLQYVEQAAVQNEQSLYENRMPDIEE